MERQQLTSVIALDIGQARTGVAIARSIVPIANPLMVITDQASLPESVAGLVREHNAKAVVVGLPRSLEGDSTNQTAYVEGVAKEISAALSVPVYFIDEAATSKKAEAELQARRKPYEKADIDMLSAVYILEDFLSQNPEIFDNVS